MGIDGEVEGILACAFEVTAQVQSRNEAQRANLAKDEFFATMSHELRTPLNAILGWTQMLRETPEDAAKIVRGLEVIERNARAQERLVSDMLDVSRSLTGKLNLILTKTSLGDIAHAAADTVRPAADAKEVRLVVDVAPDLPHVMADPARLQQVAWNLLTNAVKFTGRGGRVTVVGEQSSTHVSFRVTDTGAGIASENLAYVFERYRQVDNPSMPAHGGLGLGLAIVRHIVEAHGGSVEACSEGLGRGATFVVRLPLRAVDRERRHSVLR